MRSCLLLRLKVNIESSTCEITTMQTVKQYLICHSCDNLPIYWISNQYTKQTIHSLSKKVPVTVIYIADQSEHKVLGHIVSKIYLHLADFLYSINQFKPTYRYKWFVCDWYLHVHIVNLCVVWLRPHHVLLVFWHFLKRVYFPWHKDIMLVLSEIFMLIKAVQCHMKI